MHGRPPEVDEDAIERLLAELRRETADVVGVTRASYGPGEAAAHAMVAREAAAAGLSVERDAALNLYCRWPGLDGARPAVIIGSHMDSVPRGGNYDGAAGVLAGLAAATALASAGIRLPMDLVVMGIRAEEGAWFDLAYLGTRAAFGRVPPEWLRAPRSDSGRPLAEHLAEAGGDPEALAARRAHLRPDGVAAFLEPHIEQGPVLAAEGLALGVVTAIRGCLRFSSALCRGAYGHSGAQPRHLRRDAVNATAELILGVEAAWRWREEAGEDLTVTVGKLSTDPALHAPSKVAGETRFVLDLRSTAHGVMQAMAEEAQALADEIGRRRGVTFELGESVLSPAAVMDPGIVEGLGAALQGLGQPLRRLASGAGHDAAQFATYGVPAGMLFVRNENGSHNPDEAMATADLALAARVLVAWLLQQEKAA